MDDFDDLIPINRKHSAASDRPASPSWAESSGRNIIEDNERPPSPSWSAPLAANPSSTPEEGGFLHPPLPQPQVSTWNTPLSPPTSSVISAGATLPHPRSHPLRPGSNKEEVTRRYIEDKLLSVSRRYAKKFAPAEDETSTTPGFGKGYGNFNEIAKDLGDVVDVLWRTGTSGLQIPYLLNVAGAVGDYLGAFQPAPASTLNLLRKLDFAFASLLEGKDADTGEPLPGFGDEPSAGLSRTDMVRLKSLVEGTRVHVLEVLSRQPEQTHRQAQGQDTPQDTDVDMDRTDTEAETADEYEHQRWDDDEEGNMDIAKVYEMTLMRIDERMNMGTMYDVGDAPTWEESGTHG